MDKDNEDALILPPPPLMNLKKHLTKQLSMIETKRETAWERRRRKILKERMGKIEKEHDELTDDDLNELKGCIELGFGFNEEEGYELCETLPALDLYFAVSRQLSPCSSPRSRRSVSSSGGSFLSVESPRSESEWKVCSPGENPHQVKARLRHWAQAVACSLRQSQ